MKFIGSHNEKLWQLCVETGAVQLPIHPIEPHTFRLNKICQFPPFCRKIAFEIVSHFLDQDVQVVTTTSPDGILLVAEVARQLEARILMPSLQLKPESQFSLQYPFELHSGDRIIVIESVVTEKTSVIASLFRTILIANARLVGIGSWIDFKSSSRLLNIRQVSAFRLDDSSEANVEVK
jgi:orotate phosphoribosyltransferase